MSGLKFNFEVINGRKPFVPSIDRIDCNKGYSKDNCRIVCVAVNIAMSNWGEQVLTIIAKGIANNYSRI